METAIILGNTKLNYSWFVLTYKQGLELNGVKVIGIDYKTNTLAKIKDKILKIKPDAIFTHLSFHPHIHNPATMLQFFRDIKSKINTKVIHTCNDARTHDRYMSDLRGSFDYAFVGTYPMVSNCSEAFKIPVFYVPYSSLTYEHMGNFSPDLAFKDPVFTGSPQAHRTGWADNRADFIEKLQKIMKIKIFKTQSAEDLRKRTPELSVSAKCILGLCVGYEIEGYMDVRPFQYLGTGAFMIMRKYMGMEEYIPDNFYIGFDSYDDPMIVKELWEEWKDEDTRKLRQEAFKFIQENHSCKVRIAEVLKFMKEN